MTLSRLRRDEQEAQEKLDATREILRDAMKMYEETRADMEAAQETTRLLEQRATQETRKLTDARKEYMTLEAELSSMEEERDLMKKEIQNYAIKLSSVKQETEALEKDLIYLRFNARLEHDAYENTITEHATQQSEKESEISTLNAEIAQLEAKKQAVTQEIESHAINMEQDKKRINEEWEKIREREEVIDRRAEDARALRARLKKFCAEKKVHFPIADE